MEIKSPNRSIVIMAVIFVAANISLLLLIIWPNCNILKENALIMHILHICQFDVSIYDHWNPNNENSDFDPIDIVYTWVNGSDPLWLKYFNILKDENNITMKPDKFKIRFIDNDELRFSLRSIEKYGIHFIRYIYIVVANSETQIPFWLNISHPKIKIIPHKIIFNQKLNDTDNSVFTFNSNAIENCISNIPGLSETFIYFNDDIFIGKPVEKKDFFTNFGKPKVYVKNNYFSNVKESYKSTEGGENDFASKAFFAGLYYTLFQFEKKFKNLTNLEHLHMAYPTTKKIQTGYKKEFNEQVLSTINSPFRRNNDILMQFISFQYGMMKGEIMPVINNGYESVFVYGDFFSNNDKLITIHRNRAKMFCVNIDLEYQNSFIKAFLYIMFPNRSSFELSNAELPKVSNDNVTYLTSVLNQSSYYI